MSIAIYKPNSKKTGTAVSFRLVAFEDETTFMLEAVKQTGWDASKKLGSFKDGEKIATKFNVFELGGMLRGLETEFEVQGDGISKFYHRSASGQTSISFLSSEKGFGLGIIRGKSKFFCPLTRGELAVLREYVKWVMNKLFVVAAKSQHNGKTQKNSSSDE